MLQFSNLNGVQSIRLSAPRENTECLTRKRSQQWRLTNWRKMEHWHWKAQFWGNDVYLPVSAMKGIRPRKLTTKTPYFKAATGQPRCIWKMAVKPMRLHIHVFLKCTWSRIISALAVWGLIFLYRSPTPVMTYIRLAIDIKCSRGRAKAVVYASRFTGDYGYRRSTWWFPRYGVYDVSEEDAQMTRTKGHHQLRKSVLIGRIRTGR